MIFNRTAKKTRKIKQESGGFLMMYAVLFITIILTISMAILDLALKQSAVTSVSKESPLALYAADAGLECAFYADIHHEYFSTSTPGIHFPCGSNDITLTPINANSNPVVWNDFIIKFGAGKDLVCAKVTVSKTITNGYVSKTTIDSRGYNTDCPPGTPLRTPLVERGLNATY